MTGAEQVTVNRETLLKVLLKVEDMMKEVELLKKELKK
jgi:hypothetical protein